jgi:hypothetical protein
MEVGGSWRGALGCKFFETLEAILRASNVRF